MHNSRIALLQSLEGQRITIPSIYKICPEWKAEQHPEYERARDEDLNPWIHRWVVDIRISKALQASDFALFAALWAKESSFEVLCTAAKYFAWYFIYDDSMTPILKIVFDCGALKYDEHVLEKYKTASFQYFRFTLLGEGCPPDISAFDIELRNALYCWDENADTESLLETREVLCDEMLRYVGSLSNVDSIFRVYDTPSLEEYWERREATAGVHCVTATIPFIYGIEVGREDMQDPLMGDLRKHTSYFVHISNDIFSFRKELKDGQIENLIPILMLNRQVDCNTAMQQSYYLLQKEQIGLENAKTQLVQKSEIRSKDIAQAFAQGCQDVAMGLAHWSYCGERYFKAWEQDENNVIEFVVGPQQKAIGLAERLGLWKNPFIPQGLHVRHLCLTLLQFSPLIIWVIGTVAPLSRGLSSVFSRN